jgi:hypothetical protein
VKRNKKKNGKFSKIFKNLTNFFFFFLNFSFRTPAKAAVSGKKESAVSESKKKDESKKKAKKSSTATTAPAKATPGTSSTQAGATVSATATAPAAVSATATAAAAAAPISSSGKASTPSRGGYKKKLIRLFSNASDMSSQPDAAEQQKSQFEHEKALLVMQHKAQVESFERQLRELTDKVDSLKSENAQLVDERDAVAGERDKWEQRCLNQKKKIEALELDAEKFVKMMSQHHYVPGKTVHNVREPSFCPQF